MSGFAALMALSASQTQESQNAVQSALAQRQRKEQLQRKKQEEQERKERELAAMIRQQHFENEKRALEKQQKLEQEERAKELARQKREQEQRDALRYGPKKAKSSGGSTPQWPTSNGHAKEEVRRRRMPSDDDDDSAGGSPGLALTREEKRERRRQAEMRREFRTQKRSSTGNGYGKAGRRLPGGALDVQASPMASADSGPSAMSVKERIAAIPNALTKLNVVKRDTRTIDEILQDRAKAKGDAKVLNGDDAREFSDWFGTLKKKEPLKKATTRPTASAPGSGANSPAPPSLSSKSLHGASAAATLPAMKTNSPMPTSSSTATKTSAAVSKPSGLKAATTPKSATSHKTPLSKARTPPLPPSTSRSSHLPAPGRKRPLSPSRSASPSRAAKRRAASPNPSRNALSDEIWKMFGKDRTAYTQMDVLSDDEDMEADARALESEELRSSRVAKKEDQDALDAERRHEEEKRRRKKEREMREKRGH